jgi:hypothetical protein
MIATGLFILAASVIAAVVGEAIEKRRSDSFIRNLLDTNYHA